MRAGIPGVGTQGASTALCAADLLKAADAAERVATATSEEEQARGVIDFLAHKELIKIAEMNRHIGSIAANHSEQERRPLEVEGDYFGHHVARIPKDLAWHFIQQKNFGYEGFMDRGGMEDFLKAYPQCRTKIVSGKTVVAYGSSRAARKRSAVFGRGTLQLTN